VSADRAVRDERAEAALVAWCREGGVEVLLGHHGAGCGQRCGEYPHDGGEERRCVCGEWGEEVDHEWDLGGLLHNSSEDGWTGS